jgi:hypothetical protein
VVSRDSPSVMEDRFQHAAANAATSYPDGVWGALSVAQQCAPIYAELRKLYALSLFPNADTRNLQEAKRRALPLTWKARARVLVIVIANYISLPSFHSRPVSGGSCVGVGNSPHAQRHATAIKVNTLAWRRRPSMPRSGTRTSAQFINGKLRNTKKAATP